MAEVRRRLHHAPGVTRGADATAFAGIGGEVVVSTVIPPRPGKAVRKDAPFQIFAKGLADIWPWCVVVALAVELACTNQLKPGLEVLGYGLVQQRALGVARVVELGFCTRLPARVRMRVLCACSGGHEAVPAWAEYLTVFGIYPKSPSFDFALRSRHSLLN